MKTVLPSLFITFLYLLYVPCTMAQSIAPSAEETSPLQSGAMAPDFTVYRIDGSPYTFDADQLQNTTLIITFRGGWCPYCNTQLQELRNVLPQIKASGVDILFLSGDRPEILYSNLKDETRETINGLDYTILSDADMEAGMAFGLAFQVPDETLSRYQSRDWDLASSSMAKHQALSIPAVYVIRPGGEIAFSYANPDYRVRLPANEVKIAVDKVLAEEAGFELGTGGMDMM